MGKYVARGGGVTDKSKVVNEFRLEGLNYRQVLIKCGKKSCKKCPHGPYWYVRVKRGVRWVNIYLGKKWRSLAQKNEEVRRKRAGQKQEGMNDLF